MCSPGLYALLEAAGSWHMSGRALFLGIQEHLHRLRRESLVSAAPCWKEFTDLPSLAHEDKGICLESTEGFMGSSTRHAPGCGLEYISRKPCISLSIQPCSCVTAVTLCEAATEGLLESFKEPGCQKKEKSNLRKRQLLSLLNFPVYEQIAVASQVTCPQHCL